MADAVTVLTAFRTPVSYDQEEALAILRAVAEAQNLTGGRTFTFLGQVFAERPELFSAFRAALALDAPAAELQQFVLQGILCSS